MPANVYLTGFTMIEDMQMEFESFEKLVSELKASKPVWFGLKSEPLATEEDLITAESQLGVRLPEQYRSFVKKFGGGYFAFGNVFSVNSSSDWYIVSRNEPGNISGFVAISDNGTGDQYGFRVDGEQCEEPLFFWDHEEPDSLSPTKFDDLFDFLRSDALKQG